MTRSTVQSSTPATLDDGSDSVVVTVMTAARLCALSTPALRARLHAGTGPRFFRLGPGRSLIRIKMGDLRAWAYARISDAPPAPPRSDKKAHAI